VARAARAATGAEIHNLYGSTETGTVTRRPYDSDDPYDAGEITPGTDVEIVDGDDRPLPAGEVGLIRYRRHLQATEYHDDPVSSELAFRDGWFYPGDLGSLDGQRLRLAGRASEIVNAGGVKIDPSRVDAIAIEQPGVLDAAGFATLDEMGMTQFALAVVTGEGFDPAMLTSTLTEVFGWARPSILVKVDAIPRNAMGKPLRRDLADRLGASRQPRQRVADSKSP
jgi:long-chain acyl-CoA synthetase